jgi:hypothetical protein
MRHLGHLLRSDVRRFRTILAVWLLFQLADAVFTGVRSSLAEDMSVARILGIVDLLLLLIRWLGLLVIVPLVVQAHPLVGSEAFWMTRPIPWRGLFVSKLVLLSAVLVGLPALSEIVLMAVYRVPPAQLALVSLQTALSQAIWLLIIMVLSALTRSIARFALVVGGVLVGGVLLLYVVLAVMIGSVSEGPRLEDVTVRAVPDPAVPVVMLLLLIAAAIVPLVVQYRTRSTRVSVAAGVLGVVITVLALFMWPSRIRPVPVPAWATRDSGLRLVAASPTGEFTRFDPGPWDGGDGWQLGNARLRVSDVEIGWLASARLADSTARFEEGITLRTAGNAFSAVVPFASEDDVPAAVATRDVLGVRRVWGGEFAGQRRVQAVPAILVRHADFKKYLGATATYRGRFLLDLDHVQAVARLPLVEGAEYRDRRRRVVIEQIRPQTQAIRIRVRQVTAASMFDADALQVLSFYLRNTASAEAVAGSARADMGMASELGFPFFFADTHVSTGRASGFSVISETIRFPDGVVESSVDIGSEWLAHAELILVQTVPGGSVTRNVEIPRFEVRAAPPEAGR